MSHHYLHRLAFCVGLLALSCPGALENPGRFLPIDSGGERCSIDEVEATIFVTSCAGAGCHQAIGGAPAAGNLDLVAPELKARIKAQVSSCNGLSMAAYIAQKVKPSAACAGSPMPLGKPALSVSQIDCVEAWVNAVLDGGL